MKKKQEKKEIKRLKKSLKYYEAMKHDLVMDFIDEMNEADEQMQYARNKINDLTIIIHGEFNPDIIFKSGQDVIDATEKMNQGK